MLKHDDIPPVSLKAAYAAWWTSLETSEEKCGHTAMQAAIAAAINAWPKAFTTELEDCTGVYRRIILPLLPQENSDE